MAGLLGCMGTAWAAVDGGNERPLRLGGEGVLRHPFFFWKRGKWFDCQRAEREQRDLESSKRLGHELRLAPADWSLRCLKRVEQGKLLVLHGLWESQEICWNCERTTMGRCAEM